MDLWWNVLPCPSPAGLQAIGTLGGHAGQGLGQKLPPYNGVCMRSWGTPLVLAQAGMWAWFPDLLQVSVAIFVSSLQMGNLG